MSIREQVKIARTRAGISQEKLAAATSSDPGHISKFEGGTRDASIEKIEAWLVACGADLVAVPMGPTADPREVDALVPELRELLLRLVRLMPGLSSDNVGTIRGLVQHWETERQAAKSATAQDKRASIS